MLALLFIVFFLATGIAFAWRWGQRESMDSAPLLDKVIFTTLCLIQMAYAFPVLNLFGFIIIIGDAVILSYLWTPNLIEWMLSPLTSMWDGGADSGPSRPLLSAVHARRMQGRLDEAVTAVRRQLEEFPDDFEAQMLLAQLFAEDKKEFDQGVEVLEIILTQAHLPAQQAAVLNLLADWQIKYRSDPEAARIALQRIAELFPDDVLATKAVLRISHLPTREELEARGRPRVFKTKHVEDYVQPGGKRGVIGIAPEQTPEQRADELTARLQAYPQDTEAREQLALLYAHDYGQIDWAADQLEFLLQQPHQPDQEIIRWLELLASLQRHARDLPAAARTCQRLIHRFPQSPAAERAREQLIALGAAEQPPAE